MNQNLLFSTNENYTGWWYPACGWSLSICLSPNFWQYTLTFNCLMFSPFLEKKNSVVNSIWRCSWNALCPVLACCLWPSLQRQKGRLREIMKTTHIGAETRDEEKNTLPLFKSGHPVIPEPPKFVLRLHLS